MLRLTREFQNAHVERSPWRAVVFNQDMEYAAAATEDHRIYFWSLLGATTLEKILEFEGVPPRSQQQFPDKMQHATAASLCSILQAWHMQQRGGFRLISAEWHRGTGMIVGRTHF